MIPQKVISDQEINLNHTAPLRINSEADFVLDHPGLNNPSKGDQYDLSRRQAANYPRKDQMLDGLLGNSQFAQKIQVDSEKSSSDHIVPPWMLTRTEDWKKSSVTLMTE